MINIDERQLKDRIYEQFARICKALASARRLELLDILSQGDHGVDELARETGMSIANTSQHLQHLRTTQLVEARRHGVEIRYSLVDDKVFHLMQAVEDMAETNLAQVDRIVDQLSALRADMTLVKFDELVDLLQANNAILLDVRPTQEYAAGHIPGARSIPYGKFKKRLTGMDEGKKLIIYCRGYYSLLADKAVKRLKDLGYPAQRLRHGFNEWKAEGRQIETGVRPQTSRI